MDEFNNTSDMPATIFSFYRWCENRLNTPDAKRVV
jgi:hypothetical protein